MAKDDKLTRDERPTTKEEKLKALDAAISHIEKQYGKGSVMKLGAWNRWSAEGTYHRDLRTGIQW